MDKNLFDCIECIFFDFDGVLTNNLVCIDQNGLESVTCSRSDGLAFDVLRKLNKLVYIISTEKNPVVLYRAKKLKVPVLFGVENKENTLKELALTENISLRDCVYIGNDLNDYNAMKLCGYSYCPSDSHPKIKSIADITLNSIGGDGVVRELVEQEFKLDFINILYRE